MKKAKIAVVGATGMVGRTFLQVLEERDFPLDPAAFTLFSSARSAGSQLTFRGQAYALEELTETAFDRGFDIALFSAGGAVSEKFAPIAAAKGCVAVDNSAFWRMDPAVPLVVPEVNPEAAARHRGIIANPNCSTIQAMVALKPIHDRWVLKRVVYATYQAVSGAGLAGLQDLAQGLRGEAPKKFPRPIAGNCLPHIDVFLDNGYTKEEMKMIQETRKILGAPNLPVTATTVRVPVHTGHSEAVNLELERPFELGEVVEILEAAPGLKVYRGTDYPTALDAQGQDATLLGRIRRDESVENGLNLWIVADNLRKGAATNAVQIAELLL